MSTPKRYYSTRTGRRSSKVDLDTLKAVFLTIFESFSAECYFHEAFGFYVSGGHVAGTAGSDLEGYFLRKLRRPHLWPIQGFIGEYSEEALFDVIELLYDCISKPIDGHLEGFGWQYDSFDQSAARDEYRREVNDVLTDYGIGYELSSTGEIRALPEPGMERLLQADLPRVDPTNVEERVEAARAKFLRYHSSLDDRKSAIRDLADVLEFLRPKLENVLTKKDDGTLFRLANDFGIRHHNDRQQTNYSRAIWYSWMFYFYLATIHAAIRLIRESEESGAP